MPALAALRRAGSKNRQRTTYLHAPIGGVNTLAPIGQLPESDCAYAYNLIPTTLGLSTRTGFQEFVTGLTGGLDNSVRTLVGYTGSFANGSKDKMFALTSTGIWDVSGSTQSPTQIVAFPYQGGLAGYATAVVFGTPAGRFLLICDEANGIFVYSEAAGGFVTGVTTYTTAPWQTSTLITVGTQVQVSGNIYQCTVAGTTAATGTGPSGQGASIADNTVTWAFQAAVITASEAKAYGPSIADQNNGLYAALGGAVGAPSLALDLRLNLVAVTAWKHRLWFVERNTTRAWYTATNSVYGTLTSFDFGGRFSHGGALANLYNWSYDGGSGLDTQLVAIATSGDVAIYTGTDPSSAATFGLKGTWFTGGVPTGRRIAVEHGGEVFIIAQLGLIQLSKLVTGSSIFDRAQYATHKVANFFVQQMTLYKQLSGWAVQVNPQDNAVMVVIPQPANYTPLQIAMSLATKGWFFYRGMPILSSTVWNGQLYFGTPDGRVAIVQGPVDNQLLSSSTTYSPIAWSILPRFETGGDMNLKNPKMVRVDLLSGQQSPLLQAVAKFNFDTSEPLDTSGIGGGGSLSWDVGTWDVATWGADQVPFINNQPGVVGPILGLAGIGRSVSVALRGQAVTRTILVGMSVMFETGGPL